MNEYYNKIGNDVAKKGSCDVFFRAYDYVID